MIAVVTGAGSGIGRAAARALISGGWSVVAAGRRAAPLGETLAGADGLAVPTDVTDPDSVASLFTRTLERFGRVDLLFKNAGIGGGGDLWYNRGGMGRKKPIADIDYAEWCAVVDTNLTGSFLCAQAAFT